MPRLQSVVGFDICSGSVANVVQKRSPSQYEDIICDQPILDAFQNHRSPEVRLLICLGGAMHANKTGAAANAVTKLASQMMGTLLIAGRRSTEDVTWSQ
jgi:hypothetical protein